MASMQPTKIYTKNNIKQRQADGTFKKIDLRHYEYKNKNIDINKIKDYAHTLQNKLVKEGIHARIQLSIQTPYGDRSGSFYDGNDIDNVNIWNPNTYEYSTFAKNAGHSIEWYDDGNAIPQSFTFNVIYTDNKGGATGDNNNDCLYMCFEKLVPATGKEALVIP